MLTTSAQTRSDSSLPTWPPFHFPPTPAFSSFSSHAGNRHKIHTSEIQTGNRQKDQHKEIRPTGGEASSAPDHVTLLCQRRRTVFCCMCARAFFGCRPLPRFPVFPVHFFFSSPEVPFGTRFSRSDPSQIGWRMPTDERATRRPFAVAISAVCLRITGRPALASLHTHSGGRGKCEPPESPRHARPCALVASLALL